MNALARISPAPEAIDAEQAVLGAVMLNNAAWHGIAGFLRADHFGEPVHATIYEVLAGLIGEGRRADPLTAAPMLPAGMRVGNLTGREYLIHLAAVPATILNAPDYARAVCDCAARRGLMALAGDLSLDGSVRDRIAWAEARLIDLAEDVERADPAAVRPDESFRAVIAEAEDRRRTGRRLKGASSGLRGLDDRIGGFAPGDFVILAGRPSMGKTLLGLSMARRMAHVGVGVAFDSIEMREGAVRQRLLADETEALGLPVPYSRIATGWLNDAEMEAVRRAGARLEDLALPVIDRGNRLSDIPGHIRLARRALEKAGRELAVLVIDYLGLLAPGDRYRGSKVNEVGEVSATLKGLAKRERICVVALHQLSRANEARDDKRPRLSDLRDSGNLEQDADVVMFVHREHYYLSRAGYTSDPDKAAKAEAVANKMEVHVEKQRQGPTGNVDLWCNIAVNAVRDWQP